MLRSLTLVIVLLLTASCAGFVTGPPGQPTASSLNPITGQREGGDR